MGKYAIILLIAVICSSFSMPMSDKERAYHQYIQLYSHLAQAESAAYGIPASVILAQGLIETNAGSSILARRAHNHFGIKCKQSWEGPTYYYIDDDRNSAGELVPSCFRNYTSVEESFRDHSLFLKYRDRYAVLFTYSRDDYAAWCHGLKACGYATNDKYAQALISCIERYNLHTFDRP